MYEKGSAHSKVCLYYIYWDKCRVHNIEENGQHEGYRFLASPPFPLTYSICFWSGDRCWFKLETLLEINRNTLSISISLSLSLPYSLSLLLSFSLSLPSNLYILSKLDKKKNNFCRNNLSFDFT